MASRGLYRITAIGRPIDPAYPTNRAVLVLLPVGALAAGAFAAVKDATAGEIVWAGLHGALAAFGTWALARELAPDHDRAAFVSMGLGLAIALLLNQPGLLLLFNTLFLVRIVNRSTGLAAKLSDSILVAALTAWSVYAVPSPLMGLAGAVAFGFDAVLRDPVKHQWIFAACCLAATAFAVYLGGSTAHVPAMTTTTSLILLLIVLSYLFTIALTREIASPGDVTGHLSPARVRAGMLVGVLVPLQALFNPDAFSSAGLIWATVAGVSLIGLRKLFIPAR